MKSIYFLSVFCCFLIAKSADAQSGCTDPTATNYNPTATINDGSCLYPITHCTAALRGALSPIITESSGLVWTNGKLWTHNDSGNPPEIYSIDTTDGHTLQTVVIDNYPNIDWEDITADNDYIYIGDHGNNDGTRTDLKVLKIAKADITGASVVHVNAQAISFSYTDQTSFASSGTHNFDCEALISVGDSLYIFTKDRGDYQTRVYRMPKTPGTYPLTPYSGYNVNGLITGADYDAATNEVVLIGYLSGHTNSFLWFLYNFQGTMFFSGNKRRIEIGSGKEWQTEGVAYLSDSRFFISCETTDSIPASLYTANKPFVTSSVKDMSSTLRCDVYPNPTTGMLYVDDIEAPTAFRVLNSVGQPILAGNLVKGTNVINSSSCPTGVYFLELQGQNEERSFIRFTKQ